MWARGALVVGSISLSWSMITSQSPCLATQQCAALLATLLSMPSLQDSPASCFWAAMLIRTAALCFARAAYPCRAASPEAAAPIARFIRSSRGYLLQPIPGLEGARGQMCHSSPLQDGRVSLGALHSAGSLHQGHA